METVFIKAVVWPTDNGGISIRQTTRIHLEGLACSGQEIDVPSLNLIGRLITNAIKLYSDKLSCHQDV